MKQFYSKKMLALLCGAMALSVTGCAHIAGHNSNPNPRTLEGNNAGEILVFTPEAAKGTASISLNKYFMATLPAQHKFAQKVCSGNYVLEARAIKSQTEELEANNAPMQNAKAKKAKKNHKKVAEMAKSKQLSPIIASLNVKVEKGAVKYVQLVKAEKKGWKLEEVDASQFQKLTTLKDSNPKFVRRLPDAMLKCGQ